MGKREAEESNLRLPTIFSAQSEMLPNFPDYITYYTQGRARCDFSSQHFQKSSLHLQPETYEMRISEQADMSLPTAEGAGLADL